MNKKKLIIFGAGGNADVICSTIQDLNQNNQQIEILGFLDDIKKNSKVLGGINKKNVEKYKKYKDVYFIWSLRSTNLGKKILDKYYNLELSIKKLLTVKHPTAIISQFSKIGNGVTIHPFVNIGPGVNIKNNIHIFSHSLIGHNTSLSNFSYVANNASIGAFVRIKEGGYIGMNASIKEKVTIEKWGTVGMGSVVIKNVTENSTVVGNPAKMLIK
jgi:acetyltransferase EpsM